MPKSKHEEGWIRIEPMMPGQWCDSSLVFLEQQGLRAILQCDKNETIQHVFFVSGDTIPIRDACFVYNVPDKTLLVRGERGKNAGGYTFFVSPQWKAYSREDMEYIASVDLHNKGLQELDRANRMEQDEQVLQGEKGANEKERNTLLEKRQQAQVLHEILLINRYNFLLSLNSRQRERLHSLTTVPPIYFSGCPDEFWIPILSRLKGKI